MSKEGDKASVFRTTKVRTKLRGDDSWLQRRSEAQAETNVEKPWVAEVRAHRMNGAPIETSPVSSPTTSTPPPTKPDSERAPSSGYMIRGIFTKLDKPASSSTANGVSGTNTQFIKKPSESYKKIAPYTVRPTSEEQEGQLSTEEQEKRTEAASNVLKKSAVRQRSYVLSAAKKYESKETAPDTSLVNSSPSFVAKRVEITDDDESAATPAPASTPPPSSVIPVTSVASAPEPKPRKTANTSFKTAVNEPVAPKVEEAAPGPVKEDPPPVSVAVKDPFEGMKPGCTKVATPLPELIPECVQAVCTEPEPKDSDVSGQVETLLVELAPTSPTPPSPAPAPPAPTSPVQESPAPAPPALTSPVQESPAPAPPAPTLPVQESPVAAPPAPTSPVQESPVAAPPAPTSPVQESPVAAPPAPTSPVQESPAPTPPALTSPAPTPPAPTSPVQESPAPVSPATVSPVPLSPAPASAVTEIIVNTEPEPEPATQPSPKPRSSVDTLTTLLDPLISFDSSSTSFKDDEPVLAEEEGSSADSRAAKDGVEQEPAPEISNCVPVTDDLLALTDGPEESAEPVPPSPGRWSQDLLSGQDSESNPAKTSGTLDLLANDVILINTETRSLSTQREEEKQTDETAKGTQSPTETVTITTKTVIITDKSQEDSADPWSSHVKTTVTESSSADPFDPYPIGTTSSNSSSDLLQPHSDISINSESPTSTKNKEPSPETNISSNALESLADNVIPISADTPSLSSQRSWARTWETSTPQQANTEKSQEAAPGGQTVDQTLVMFERKSTENDSPWDRWTSPTVYTITTTGEEDEEEEEEESPRDTQTETVTTVTTIREIHSEPQPAMDRYETYSRTVIEEDQRVQTPEPEAKKGFVYVKEYVNATELSLHNAREVTDSGSDYLTSRSTTLSYSSPSTYSSGPLSSTCSYCGELVGNDAKITIEHLNINCHPTCFKCEMCSKPMGDLLDSMFLHGGKVHCETCYCKALD